MIERHDSEQDVEAVDLRLDHAALDPPADEIEILLELGGIDRLRGRALDHDLLDLRAGLHRLLADHRDVDGHLPPAVDRVAEADDLALDDRAARLLRAEIGARQEHHADRQPPGAGLVAAILDRVVEEAAGQLNMDAGAVARLAVGIDRTAMPHRLQRIDRGRDDATRGLPVGRRDEPDAAGIALELGAVHAVAGEAEAFCFSRHGWSPAEDDA